MAHHPHSALQIYQFLSSLRSTCPQKDTFDAILLSLQTPRFAPVSTIVERWSPTFASNMPTLLVDFQQLMLCASRSPDYDTLLMRVSEHYPLIYRVSCFLETDLQLELFVRCLCLDSSTPVQVHEVKQTLLQFLNELGDLDTREYVQDILVQDHHGYLTAKDCISLNQQAQQQGDFQGVLDLDKVYEVVNDSKMFDELMAIIQTNTVRGVIWSQTIQEIYELVAGKNIWEQLAPLLQQVYVKQDTNDYESYEDYVKKNFLDDGGQQFLDDEINRAQVEHMLGNLSM